MKVSQKLAMIAVLLLSVCFLGIFLIRYLFRTETMVDQGGMARMSYRWGRPAALSYDRNQDGVPDYRALLRGIQGTDVPPSEVWVDEDFDGVYEQHYVLHGAQAISAEFDKNGDGDYDRDLSGDAADARYREWLSRWREARRSPQEREFVRLAPFVDLLKGIDDEEGLQFHVESRRVTTVGMSSVSHPELTIVIADPGQIEFAQKLLVRFAIFSMRDGPMLAAGQEFSVGEASVTIENGPPGTLQLNYDRWPGDGGFSSSIRAIGGS